MIYLLQQQRRLKDEFQITISLVSNEDMFVLISMYDPQKKEKFQLKISEQSIKNYRQKIIKVMKIRNIYDYFINNFSKIKFSKEGEISFKLQTKIDSALFCQHYTLSAKKLQLNQYGLLKEKYRSGNYTIQRLSKQNKYLRFLLIIVLFVLFLTFAFSYYKFNRLEKQFDSQKKNILKQINETLTNRLRIDNGSIVLYGKNQ